MTKVAVVGVGHLGKQHARLYSELEGVELFGVVDILELRAKEIAQLYKVRCLHRLSRPFRQSRRRQPRSPDSRSCWPHPDLLEHGIDVLVEKPISSTAEEARMLIDLAAKNNRVLQVGHVERFNPVVTLLPARLQHGRSSLRSIGLLHFHREAWILMSSWT